MYTHFWSIAAWIPLGIGLLAAVILVVLVTWDFAHWYIKQKRNNTMPKPSQHVHLVFSKVASVYKYETVCGTLAYPSQCTDRLTVCSCPACFATYFSDSAPGRAISASTLRTDTFPMETDFKRTLAANDVPLAVRTGIV